MSSRRFQTKCTSRRKRWPLQGLVRHRGGFGSISHRWRTGFPSGLNQSQATGNVRFGCSKIQPPAQKLDPIGANIVYIKKKQSFALHQKSIQDGHPRAMKTEQPISRQPVKTPKTSLAEEHIYSSARTVPPQALGRSEDPAAFPSFIFAQRQENSEDTSRKWSRAATFRFALVSCSLFWLVVALCVWAYTKVP